jgi:hypothetical protein
MKKLLEGSDQDSVKGVHSPEAAGNERYVEITDEGTTRRSKKKYIPVLPDDFAQDADGDEGTYTVKFAGNRSDKA